MLKTVVRESAVYGVGRIATSVIAFATLPVYTAIFSPDQFGLLNLFVTGGVLFGLVSSAGLPTAVTRYFHDEGIGEESIFSAVGYFLIQWGGALTAIAVVVLAGLGIADMSPPAATALALALIAAVLGQFVELISLFARMRHRPGLFLWISLPGAVGGSLVSVALVLLFGDELILYFVGIFAGQAVSLLIGFRRSGLALGQRSAETRATMRKLLRFSIPLLPAALIQYLLNYSDQWILAASRDMDAVGVYAVGVRFGGATLMATSLVTFAFLPHSMRLIHEDDDYAGYQLERSLRLLSALFCITAIAVTFVSPFVLRQLIAPEYHQAFSVIGFIALGHVFFAYTYFSSLGSWKKERSADYSIAVAVGVAANLGLNLLLIPRFGILAAGVNMAVAMAIVALISFVLSATRHPYPFSYGRLLLGSALTLAWVADASTSDWIEGGPGPVDLLIVIALTAVLIAMNLKGEDYKAARESLRSMRERSPR